MQGTRRLSLARSNLPCAGKRTLRPCLHLTCSCYLVVVLPWRHSTEQEPVTMPGDPGPAVPEHDAQCGCPHLRDSKKRECGEKDRGSRAGSLQDKGEHRYRPVGSSVAVAVQPRNRASCMSSAACRQGRSHPVKLADTGALQVWHRRQGCS